MFIPISVIYNNEEISLCVCTCARTSVLLLYCAVLCSEEIAARRLQNLAGRYSREKKVNAPTNCVTNCNRKKLLVLNNRFHFDCLRVTAQIRKPSL